MSAETLALVKAVGIITAVLVGVGTLGGILLHLGGILQIVKAMKVDFDSIKGVVDELREIVTELRTWREARAPVEQDLMERVRSLEKEQRR